MNPFTGGTGDLERTAREWVFSDQLRDLVAMSGAKIPATGTREALAWLDDFSAAEWDFRGGRERSAMRLRDFEPGVAATITASLRDLGLSGRTTPAGDTYDRMLILGGGAPACVARPAFAASLIAGGLRVGGVAALSSDRPLRAAERDFLAGLDPSGDTATVSAAPRASGGTATASAAPRASGDRAASAAPRAPDDSTASVGLGAAGDTEADAIAAGARLAFGREITIVCARRTGNTSRANTADTYDAWRAADPGRHDRVLIVTTDIYVPFQHFDAVRKLGLGSGRTVETIGVPAGFELPNGFRVQFTLAHYLQEVRSAIRSLRRLLAAVDGDRAIAETR